jgi:6,7-dimethyl-8-ribityllumazine synthase
MVTNRLLEGARRYLEEHEIPDDKVDVVWVPGAFELPVAAEAAAASGRYGAIVALGCVIRGETMHFELVASEAARGLNAIARVHCIAIGFGVLTTENIEQALARAGGDAGNKGYEAAEAALQTADVLADLRRAPPRD